jgi:3-dehydroquinate synthase
MDYIEREIRVSFRHRVHFTRRVFDLSNPLLKTLLENGEKKRPKRILMVLDKGLADACPDLDEQIESYFAAFPAELKLVCPPLLVEGGERVKNSCHHISEIHRHVDRYHLDRHSYVLAAGGGALLDMAGFAAATAHRGIRHVRLPSTTLSQADSGVGVKNGINAFGKKNFIGTFSPPFAVVNDFGFLASLPPREMRGGLVEAVKVALIRDGAFFEEISREANRLRQFEQEAIEALILRCAELHIGHIASAGDPFELGSARPLDFGHWAAHKLEQISEYKIRHGEAVAIGIAIDVLYSSLAGLLEATAAERIVRLLETLGFELFAGDLLRVNPKGQLLILEGLEEFREHLGGELTVTLLSEIGRGIEVHEMDEALVVQAIGELAKRGRRLR